MRILTNAEMLTTESKQVRLSYLVTTGQYCPAAILSYMIESRADLPFLFSISSVCPVSLVHRISIKCVRI